MSSNVWDEIPPPNGDFPEKFTFDKVGTSIAGTITNIRKFTWEGKTSPDLWIQTADGERSVICGQANLLTQLLEIKPMVGDKIAVVYTGERKAKLGNAKVFDVQVKRADGSTVDPAPEKATSAADLL